MKLGSFYLIITLSTLHAFAADPVAKTPPSPSQGVVNSSGKFTPAYLGTATNMDVPRTRGEAEDVLKRVLNLKQTSTNTFQIGRVEFDKQKRTVALPASVCVRDQIIEYALVTTGGKTYESLLSTEASPVDVHLALLLLDMGQVPVLGELKQPAPIPDTNAVRIEVCWQTNGQTITVPLAELVCFAESRPDVLGKPLSLDRWLYNGSQFDQWGFAAQREGSLIALIRDPVALVNNPGADRDNDLIHVPNIRLLPERGMPVQIVLRLPEPVSPPPPVPIPGVTPITPLSTNRF